MAYINELNDLDKELLIVDNYSEYTKSKGYPRFYVYCVGNETTPDFKNVIFKTLKGVKRYITNKVGHMGAKIYLLNPRKTNDDFDVVLVSSRKEFGKWNDDFILEDIIKPEALK